MPLDGSLPNLAKRLTLCSGVKKGVKMSLSNTTTFTRSMRTAIVAFVIAGVVALFAYGLYTWQYEKREVRDNLTILSSFLASTAQAMFDNLGNGLEPLGQLLHKNDVLRNPEASRAILMKFQARYPEVGSMAVISLEGVMLINTLSRQGEPLPDYRRDPPYLEKLKAVIASPDRYTIGPPEYGKLLKQWRFPFRHVVRNRDDRPLFVLQAAIPLESTRNFLQRLPVPPRSFIGLLREDGYQQARWPAEDPSKIYGRLSPGPVAHMIKTNPAIRSGFFNASSPWTGAESQRVGTFTRLPTAPMYAYVSAPASYLWDRWWRQNVPVLLSFFLLIAVFGGVISRVTLRERAHRLELLHQARRDNLTDLPNRAAAEEILKSAADVARAAQQQFSVLFLDLDHFKDVNDTLGHTTGDQLLLSATREIKRSLRNADILTRFGGDEFLMILPGTGQAGATITTERILAAFQKPIQVGDQALAVTPSIGIAVYPDHGRDMETLIKHADTAMYESKRQGRNAYTVYVEQLGTRVRARIEIEHQLRNAVQQNEFRLVYQPIIDIASGRMVGAEALIRWQAADGKSRSPAEFIGIAEDCGLILPIGEWVLKTACAQAQSWVAAGHDLWIAVNLSTRQFQDPHLVQKIEAALRDSGLEHRRLEIEITESAAMLHPEATINILGQLKTLGIHIAIDDFGTGYSSLSYLKRIPADKIKVDKSFVAGVNGGADDTAIVRTVVALATALEKQTVAEGIESEDQFNAIRKLGCDQAQGYWFSRPVTPDNFAQLLTDHRDFRHERKESEHSFSE